MKEQKADETSRMILLYFMEKTKKLKEKKEGLQQEIEELAKINKEIRKAASPYATNALHLGESR